MDALRHAAEANFNLGEERSALGQRFRECEMQVRSTQQALTAANGQVDALRRALAASAAECEAKREMACETAHHHLLAALQGAERLQQQRVPQVRSGWMRSRSSR